MANNLLQYIVTQEHAGYSELQIRQALAQNGYSQKDIDDAFKQLKPKDNDEVRQLVQQYANQGYLPLQIFTTLTQQGHPAGAVRKAINDTFGPLVMPQSHTTVIFAVIALLIIAGGGFFLLSNEQAPTQAYPIGGDEELSSAEQISRIVAGAAKDKAGAVQQCMLFLDENRGYCLSALATYPSVSDDRLCDQIVQIEIRDSCLLNFVNEKTESVCARVQLRDSIDFCQTITSLRNTQPST